MRLPYFPESPDATTDPKPWEEELGGIFAQISGATEGSGMHVPSTPDPIQDGEGMAWICDSRFIGIRVQIYIYCRAQCRRRQSNLQCHSRKTTHKFKVIPPAAAGCEVELLHNGSHCRLPERNKPLDTHNNM